MQAYIGRTKFTKGAHMLYKTWTKQKSEKVYNWDKFSFGYLLPYVFTSPQFKALRKSKTKGQTEERKEWENKWKYKRETLLQTYYVGEGISGISDWNNKMFIKHIGVK